MTTGASGTYAVNGTTFILLPTTAKHTQRDNMGFDGNGHPVYPSVRSFELKWNLMHTADAQQFINAYNAVQNTGTVSFDLPYYGANGYEFRCYSGCTIEEPEFDEYFQGYLTNGRLVIHNVRT